jgi:hypothetical protein
MTGKNIGMLIGDPIPSALTQPSDQPPSTVLPRSSVFPTYHTIDGGLRWSRNDHDRLPAHANQSGEPSESIFAASNSSMLLVPYLTLFASGGKDGKLHYEQYTINNPFLEREADSALAVGDSAGGFSIAANWALGSYSPQSELHSRALSSDVATISDPGDEAGATPPIRSGAAHGWDTLSVGSPQERECYRKWRSSPDIRMHPRLVPLSIWGQIIVRAWVVPGCARGSCFVILSPCC